MVRTSPGRRGAGMYVETGSSRETHRRLDEQMGQLAQHLLRLLEDVAVRVTAELVAARPCVAFAPPVLLPGVARVVVAVAVELDRQAPFRPAAVDAVSAGDAVGLGPWQVMLAQQ